MWHLPGYPTLMGRVAEGGSPVAPNFRNSVVITVPAALISAFIGSINGYIFAKWRFPGSDVLFLAFLVGMFLPYQGMLIPWFDTPVLERLTSLEFYGSMWALVMVHCIFGIPITALLFRGYYAGIPNELLDAARSTAAASLAYYRHILLPISLPAFAVVLLWQFTTIWNDYLLGLVVLSNADQGAVNVAVQSLAGSYYTEWNVQMAAA